jgi:hypothetical protein
MERVEDAFEELHEQSEHLRRQLRERAAFYAMLLYRDTLSQRKLKENADETSKEKERVGVPDVELGAQGTSEAYSEIRGARGRKEASKSSQSSLPQNLLGIEGEAISTSIIFTANMAKTSNMNRVMA